MAARDLRRILRLAVGSVLVAELWEQYLQPIDAQLSGVIVLRRARALARGPVRARLDVRISERLAEHRHRTMALMRAAI